MTALVAYSAGILLEGTILFRCFRTGSFRQYPFFCVYLSCIFVTDIGLFPAYKLVSPSVFRTCYWAKEFVCVIAGYAVIMEIIETAFARFDGPKKLGRNAGLITFAAIVGITALQAGFQRAPNSVQTSIQVEANLRGAELILLSIVIGVIFYYSVPVGRNLKGIIVGYGICTAAVVMNEAIRTFAGPSFQPAFSTIWSYSYVLALGVWAAALWSYEPNPVPESANQTEGDYEALAARTRTTLAGVRGYLRKVVPS
jgi:hypothetical protein